MSAIKNAVTGIIRGSSIEPAARAVWYRLFPQGRIPYQDRRDMEALRSIMERHLRPDSSGLDIGCNVGAVLAMLKSFAPRGQHVALEPIPALAANLRRQFPDVRVLEVAAGAEDTQATFNHVVNDPGYSSLRHAGPLQADARVEHITVNVRRLDSLLPDFKPDFVKIDVEGGELQVLAGADELFRRARPTLVFEHQRESADAFGTTAAQMFDRVHTDFAMDIWGLEDYLAQRPPLTRERFVSLQRRSMIWNFIARPRGSNA